MMKAPEFLRDMRPGEEDAVDTLLRAAFAATEEAALVRKLRKTSAMAGESVLPYQGQIVGYFALSKMVQPIGWLCLAPVAIDPDWQGYRHGSRMIGMLTEWARISRTPVVVLGKVGFYERAGFSQKLAENLTSPYPIEHTMLAGTGPDAPSETLIYPQAFEGL